MYFVCTEPILYRTEKKQHRENNLVGLRCAHDERRGRSLVLAVLRIPIHTCTSYDVLYSIIIPEAPENRSSRFAPRSSEAKDIHLYSRPREHRRGAKLFETAGTYTTFVYRTGRLCHNSTPSILQTLIMWTATCGKKTHENLYDSTPGKRGNKQNSRGNIQRNNKRVGTTTLLLKNFTENPPPPPPTNLVQYDSPATSGPLVVRIRRPKWQAGQLAGRTMFSPPPHLFGHSRGSTQMVASCLTVTRARHPTPATAPERQSKNPYTHTRNNK